MPFVQLEFASHVSTDLELQNSQPRMDCPRQPLIRRPGKHVVTSTSPQLGDLHQGLQLSMGLVRCPFSVKSFRNRFPKNSCARSFKSPTLVCSGSNKVSPEPLGNSTLIRSIQRKRRTETALYISILPRNTLQHLEPRCHSRSSVTIVSG